MPLNPLAFALGLVAVLCLFIEPTFATVVAGILGLIALVFSAMSWRHALERVKALRTVFAAILVFLVIGAASAIWSETGADAVFTRIGKLLGISLILSAFLMIPLSERVARSGALGAGLGIALIAVFLIENAFIGSLRDFFVPAGVSGDDAAYYANNAHKAPMAVVAILAFPFLGYAASVGRVSLAGRVLLGMSGLVLLALIVGDHVTVQGAFLLGILAAVGGWIAPRIVGGLVVGTAAIWLLVVPTVLATADLSPLLQATQGKTSLQHRVLIADFVAQRIAERPVLGWGLDASRAMPGGSDRIRDTEERLDRFRMEEIHETVWRVAQNMPLHPHNLWLQIRLELGIPGAIAFLGVLWALCRQLWRRGDARARAAGYGALCTVLTVASISYGAWQSWWLAFLTLTVLFWRGAIPRPDDGGTGLQRDG